MMNHLPAMTTHQLALELLHQIVPSVPGRCAEQLAAELERRLRPVEAPSHGNA